MELRQVPWPFVQTHSPMVEAMLNWPLAQRSESLWRRLVPWLAEPPSELLAHTRVCCNPQAVR